MNQKSIAEKPANIVSCYLLTNASSSRPKILFDKKTNAPAKFDVDERAVNNNAISSNGAYFKFVLANKPKSNLRR